MRKTLGLMMVLVLGWASLAVADRPTDHFTTITKPATATSAQTDTTLWDPAAGKRIVLMRCTISSWLAQTVELEDDDGDVVPPLYFESYGIKELGNGYAPIWEGNVNEVLTYSTSASGHALSGPATAISCSGYEV